MSHSFKVQDVYLDCLLHVLTTSDKVVNLATAWFTAGGRGEFQIDAGESVCGTEVQYT